MEGKNDVTSFQSGPTGNSKRYLSELMSFGESLELVVESWVDIFWKRKRCDQNAFIAHDDKVVVEMIWNEIFRMRTMKKGEHSNAKGVVDFFVRDNDGGRNPLNFFDAKNVRPFESGRRKIELAT